MSDETYYSDLFEQDATVEWAEDIECISVKEIIDKLKTVKDIKISGGPASVDGATLQIVRTEDGVRHAELSIEAW